MKGMPLKTIRFRGCIYHYVIFFYDCGEKYYIYKYFGKDRRIWYYAIWSEDEYQYRTKKNKQ